MASVIFLGIREQKSLKQHLADGGYINSPFRHTRPVIAKGNIIEGIEAKW